MKCVSIILAILALGVGLKAAWLWLSASRITADPHWPLDPTGQVPFAPVIPEQVQSGWTSAILEAMHKSAELNARAALWTAAAVLLGCLTTIAGVWPLWPCSN